MAAEATFTLRAIDATKQAFASVQNSLQRMTSSAEKLTSAFGVGLGVAGIGMMIKSVTDLGGQLNDLSIEAGMTTDSFQGLAYANLQNGLAFEQTAKAAENLRSKIQDAVSGNDAAIKSFAALNLTGEGLRALSIDQQWEVIAISLANATDKQAAYNAIADIFGAKIGPKMKETLDQIATSGFDQISKGFDSIKLSDKEIKNLDRAGDSFQILFSTVKSGAASAFVGAQNYLEKFLTEMERAKLRVKKGGLFIGPMTEEALAIPHTTIGISPASAAAMAKVEEDRLNAEQLARSSKEVQNRISLNIKLEKTFKDVSKAVDANTESIKKEIQGYLEAAKSSGQKFIDQQNRLDLLLQSGAMTLDEYTIALYAVIDAFDKTPISESTFVDSLTNTGDEIERIAAATKELNMINDAGNIIAQGFEDAILSGQKLQEVIKGLGRDLLRMVFQQSITQPLAAGISGALQGMFRANGGPVSSGSPYIVGERGPELFVPRASGSIVSNSNMNQGGGSAGSSINVNYNIAAGVTRSELAPILEQERRRLKAEIPDMVRRGGAYRSAFA
jgi:hypothetical protein